MAAIALFIGLFSVQCIDIKPNIAHKLSTIALSGPILYGITNAGMVYRIDVDACTTCPVMNTTGYSDGVTDILLLPGGNILVLTGDGLRLYTPPSSNPIWSDPAIVFGGAVISPNGTIYLSNSNGLYTFDPLTNGVNFIGPWPSGVSVNELFYSNGIMYGTCGQPPSALVQVNEIDPDQSSIVYSNSPLFGDGGITNGGYTTMPVAGGAKILYQYNLASNSASQLCNFTAFLPPINGGLAGLSDVPAGFTDLPCLCTTFAGTVNNQTFNVCIPGSVSVPYNNDATLDADDILRYILFSNTNDTLGSIIVQSSSWTIAFNPASMQTGVTYYLATIAGDNLNGNVDLDDPCLDFSNTAAEVTWRPQPEVVFSLANPDVCAGDCTTVTATFNGAPPFALTYVFLGDTFTQTFNGNSGSFEVCVPPGTMQGGIMLSAVALEDAWCVCQ